LECPLSVHIRLEQDNVKSQQVLIGFYMFSEYIEAALERAVYKTIEDEDPIFVSVPELPGAWASGKTIEEARKELISVIEGWIALRLRMGRSIPPIGGHTITASTEPVSIVE
jgi:predicted RNase H-like HicB family nuclease